MAEQDTINPQIVDAVELTNQVIDEAARQAALPLPSPSRRSCKA